MAKMLEGVKVETRLGVFSATPWKTGGMKLEKLAVLSRMPWGLLRDFLY